MWWTHLLIAVVIYAALIYYVWFMGEVYQEDLNKFDLNNDGNFNGVEITSEMKEAMRKVTNDTARNYVPIAGAVYSIIITTIIFVIDSIIILFWKRVLKPTIRHFK